VTPRSAIQASVLPSGLIPKPTTFVPSDEIADASSKVQSVSSAPWLKGVTESLRRMHHRSAASIFPPSTVTTAALVDSAVARATKASATSRAYRRTNERASRSDHWLFIESPLLQCPTALSTSFCRRQRPSSGQRGERAKWLCSLGRDAATRQGARGAPLCSGLMRSAEDRIPLMSRSRSARAAVGTSPRCARDSAAFDRFWFRTLSGAPTRERIR
jgi:hypothetical protein